MNDSRSPIVLHVVVSLATGGLERLVVDWTNARNRRQSGSTYVCCLDKRGELADLVEGDVCFALNANRARFPVDVKAVRTLRRHIGNQFPGQTLVVHSHNVAAQQYAAFAVSGTGIRHIHTEHGTNPHAGGCKNRIRYALMKHWTDVTVAVSQDTATALNRMQKIPLDQMQVIPNGVNVAVERGVGVRHAARQCLGLQSSDLAIGSVGRLAEVKQYDRLIRLFAELPAQMGERRLVLLFIGDGPERDSLDRLAQKQGVHDRVHFAGYRADAQRLTAALDLFVLPSRSEGLSTALLDAMLHQVPVLITDVGEGRAIIDNGGCGWLLPVRQDEWAPAFTELVHRIQANDPQVEEKAAQASDRVKRCYSLTATLDAYEGLYQE